jgi:hypothetical protein
LHQTASTLAQVLEQVPSLNAELTRASDGKGGLIHLRLVSSAAELALLPFELVLSPAGFPAEGKSLLLQLDPRICLTREVRRPTPNAPRWWRTPRILVAAAEPDGFPPVPTRAHVLAIRRAIEPWVEPALEGEDEVAPVERLMTVLPRASLRSIRNACRQRPYTHVHILAHGHETRENGDSRFGVALHDDYGSGATIVDGTRLAEALRPQLDGGVSCDYSYPQVLTLATCDSGRVGSVIIPGASVAHDIHESGIPLVIASQFPLTVAASVMLVEDLYPKLLFGEDPLCALHSLRQRLHVELRETHDWAALVAYTALPADFERQLLDARYKSARFAIDVRFKHADRILELDSRSPAQLAELSTVLATLAIDMKRLSDSMPAAVSLDDKHRRAEVLGMLGSAEKRRAEILFRRDPDDGDAWRRALRTAGARYYAAWNEEVANHWVAVQYLTVPAALAEPLPPNYTDDFWSARKGAMSDVNHQDAVQAAWAWCSVAELQLLALQLPVLEQSLPNPLDKAVQALERVKRLVPPDSFVLYSTRRQLRRYIDWWKPPLLVEAAQRLLAVVGDQIR